MTAAVVTGTVVAGTVVSATLVTATVVSGTVVSAAVASTPVVIRRARSIIVTGLWRRVFGRIPTIVVGCAIVGAPRTMSADGCRSRWQRRRGLARRRRDLGLVYRIRDTKGRRVRGDTGANNKAEAQDGDADDRGVAFDGGLHGNEFRFSYAVPPWNLRELNDSRGI